MRQSKWAYYADFVFYPLAILGLPGATLAHPDLARALGFSGVAAAAVGLWSVVEYALHRWAFHRWLPLQRLHDAHHANPHAYVGTPLWVTAGCFAGIWVVLVAETPGWVASAFTTGLMIGYLRYAFVHDAVHRLRTRPGTWLHAAKIRHAAHHHTPRGNFGVSTVLWDRMFRTALTPTSLAGKASAQRDGRS